MKELNELKEKLMDILKDYSQSNKFSKEDAESIKAISASIDHICNIMQNDNGYSERGYYPLYMYDDRKGGEWTAEGSYARGRTGNVKRDSMGRYSADYDRGYSRHGDMLDELHRMIKDAPNDQIRGDIQRLADKIERM